MYPPPIFEAGTLNWAIISSRSKSSKAKVQFPMLMKLCFKETCIFNRSITTGAIAWRWVILRNGKKVLSSRNSLIWPIFSKSLIWSTHCNQKYSPKISTSSTPKKEHVPVIKNPLNSRQSQVWRLYLYSCVIYLFYSKNWSLLAWNALEQ